MQRLRQSEGGGGGGGGGGGWNHVWPPIAEGATYEALFGDFVLVNSGEAVTNIILPFITEESDGAEIAVKAGVSAPDGNGRRVPGHITVHAADGNTIEPFDAQSGAGSVELEIFGPHRFSNHAGTQIFAASFRASGWFMAGYWSFGNP
jgi:hypothetical protein